MTTAEFNAYVEAWLARVRSTLIRKGDEYARGDRLSNFKHGAALQRVTPLRAALGYQTKHVVSIVDLVADYDTGKLADEAVWLEKLGDAINYYILLGACVEDERKLSAEAEHTLLEPSTTIPCAHCNTLCATSLHNIWSGDNAIKRLVRLCDHCVSRCAAG